jgi:hypothetical protein
MQRVVLDAQHHHTQHGTYLATIDNVLPGAKERQHWLASLRVSPKLRLRFAA